MDLPVVAVEGTIEVTALTFDADSDVLRNNVAARPTAVLDGRILVAEDGIDNQRLIAYHLQKAGATVTVVSNGLLALQEIERSEQKHMPYHLLVTDVQMPEMDGHTLARVLRARHSTLPIIALTAHAMAEDKTKCIDAGCNAYATKPLDRDSLLAACAQWMRVDTDSAGDAVPMVHERDSDADIHIFNVAGTTKLHSTISDPGDVVPG